jgi:hypothetical protein
MDQGSHFLFHLLTLPPWLLAKDTAPFQSFSEEPMSQQAPPSLPCHPCTLKWASDSSSCVELEGEGVADLLPGGDGEPWPMLLRMPIWEMSWDWLSALMWLASIAGRPSRGPVRPES